MTNIIEKYPEYTTGLAGLASVSDGQVKVRSFGVTSLLFDDGNTKLLFDFMVTRPPLLKVGLSPLDSDRQLVEKMVADYNLQGLEAIFASHSHYDHILDIPALMHSTSARLCGSLSTLNVARGNGIREERLTQFAAGDSFTAGNFTVKVLASIHSKAAFYNNDLGKIIQQPLTLPAKKKRFTEGGSYDFLVTHGQKTYLIRPSCNYIKDSLNGIKADVLFLGIGQLSKMSDEEKRIFYAETVGKVHPQLVIPVHWDNFFAPLDKADTAYPKLFDDTVRAMDYMIKRLSADGIQYKILPALKYTQI